MWHTHLPNRQRRPRAITLLLTIAITLASPLGVAKHPSLQTNEELRETLQETPFDLLALAYLVANYIGYRDEPAADETSINQELETSGAFYEDALSYMEQGNTQAAVIQLRNAIDADPRNLSAYLLVAEIYQDNRSPVAAEQYLRDAQRQGADPALVTIPLAEALLASEQHDVLLRDLQISSAPTSIRAELQVMRSRAHMGLQQYDEARTSIDSALSADPDLVTAHIEAARLATILTEFPEAESHLQQIETSGPYIADYWMIKAELARAQGQVEDIPDLYGRALSVDPDHRLARTAIAELYIRKDELDAALPHIDHLRSVYPGDLRGLELELSSAIRLNDQPRREQAIIAFKSLLTELDYVKLQEEPSSLYTVASLHYLSGSMTEAATMFAQYLEYNPSDILATNLMVTAQLESGQAEAALRSLTLAKDELEKFPRYRVLLAQTYIALKNHQEAILLLDDLVSTMPDDGNLRLQRAKVNANLGRFSLAAEELQALVAQNYIPAIPTLANLLLARAQYDEVLALTKVSDEFNASADAAVIRGQALLGADRRELAREEFNEALSREPENVDALFNLALIARIDGNLDAAERQFLDLLTRQPGHLPSIMQLSNISQRKGDSLAAIEYLQDAVAIQPDKENFINLFDLLTENNREQEARAMMSQLKVAFPDDLEVLAAEARFNNDTGNTERARQIYVNMRNLAVERGAVKELVDIARFQFSSGDIENARRSIRDAENLDPDAIPLLVTKSEFSMQEGNYADARELAQQVISKAPTSPLGYRLMGDVLAAAGQSDEALEIYGQGLAVTDGSVALVLRYYSLVRETAGPADALAYLEQQLAEQPAVNYLLLRALAAGYADNNRLDDAIELNRRLLGERPRDPVVLNNLALALFNSQSPDARDIAQQAYDIAPDNPAIMDTLGWILVNEGETSLGATILRNALTRASGDPEIRYHYAVALERSGRQKTARQELQTLLASGKSFNDRDKAEALFRELSQ